MADYDGILKRKLSTSILTVDDAYYRAVEDREAALFHEFGIERSSPDAWRELALALARRHVPAFMPEPGRPATVRDKALTWFLASLYFQRRDEIGPTAADRLVAAHFSIRPETVRARLKEMRRRGDYQEGGPLLTFFAKVENKFGLPGLLKALAGSLTPDPEFAKEVAQEAERLQQYPY